MWAYIKAAILSIPIVDKWSERIYRFFKNKNIEKKKEAIDEANTPGEFTDLVN